MISISELIEKVEKINPNNQKGTWKYIDIASVDRFQKKIILDNVSEITADSAPSRARQLVFAGDIIISTVRPNLNTVAIVPKELDGAIASTGFCVLRPNNLKVDSKYLYHYVKSEAFVNSLVKLAIGANYPAVSDKIIKEQRLKKSSLYEQKKIAKILDKAEDIFHKRKLAIKLADNFLRAKFLEMFGTPAQNKHDFPKGTIRDLVDSVNYGTSAKASVNVGKYPILRMGNITYQGGWDFTDLKYLDLNDKDKSKFLVEKGDLLFNRTNSKELVGKTAVYEADRPMAFAGYLIRIRPNSNGNNYYLSGFLNSTHGKTTLTNMCKSIVGMANINAQELQDIEILIPPKNLQDEYERIYKKMSMELAIAERSAKQLQLLIETLASKYFI
ncbi:restriction endonuclease subunit S [Klebsiella quasipneumoniae]|uniref:restriction endonuclease subunit S n=1 Tax=Klebsiella quasipneumoniae TaxID=1463165 RepID=UPI003BF10331